MMSMLVAVVVVAFCGAAGLLGYFTHRFIYLLQTEVKYIEAIAARQEEKANRINKAIDMHES